MVNFNKVRIETRDAILKVLQKQPVDIDNLAARLSMQNGFREETNKKIILELYHADMIKIEENMATLYNKPEGDKDESN